MPGFPFVPFNPKGLIVSRKHPLPLVATLPEVTVAPATPPVEPKPQIVAKLWGVPMVLNAPMLPAVPKIRRK